jgi:hypothetical protein
MEFLLHSVEVLGLISDTKYSDWFATIRLKLPGTLVIFFYSTTIVNDYSHQFTGSSSISGVFNFRINFWNYRSFWNSGISLSTMIWQSQNFYWRRKKKTNRKSQTRYSHFLCGIRANDASIRAIDLEGVAAVSSKLVIVTLSVSLFL